MIEIITQYKQDWTMFTLASLLDQNEDFRLHLYVDEKHWKSAEVRWIIRNFDRVKINSNGTRVIIGQHQNDESGTNAGSVRIYEYDPSWNSSRSLLVPNLNLPVSFGIFTLPLESILSLSVLL